MTNKNYLKKYKIEDIYKNLEIINNWINNCDTKTSIVLGVYGVIGTIIFTNEKVLNKYIDVGKNIFQNLSINDLIYILNVIISILIMVYGIYKLLSVLVPTLKTKYNNKKSHIYFGGIAKFDSSFAFKTSLSNQTENTIKDELVDQLYINSIICEKKFNNYKEGIIYSLIGFIALMIISFIGFLIY